MFRFFFARRESDMGLGGNQDRTKEKAGDYKTDDAGIDKFKPFGERDRSPELLSPRVMLSTSAAVIRQDRKLAIRPRVARMFLS
jgi:hypothetical protein